MRRQRIASADAVGASGALSAALNSSPKSICASDGDSCDRVGGKNLLCRLDQYKRPSEMLASEGRSVYICKRISVRYESAMNQFVLSSVSFAFVAVRAGAAAAGFVAVGVEAAAAGAAVGAGRFSR